MDDPKAVEVSSSEVIRKPKPLENWPWAWISIVLMVTACVGAVITYWR